MVQDQSSTPTSTFEQQHGRNKNARVKNKAPAEIQISAEQLLREAAERSDEMRLPAQRILDDSESAELRQIKRRTFEDALRRNRTSIGTWIKYAAWEESIGESARARSIYERVLEVDYRNTVIWLKYAEMEMKVKNVQHARNVWNRAVTLLPFVEQFWYKYAYFEEILGNVAGSREIFERWLEWNPPASAFLSYIKLELRYKETSKARALYERLLVKFSHDSKLWIAFAKFEEGLGELESCRQVFTRGCELFCNSTETKYPSSKLVTAFAKFEIRMGELERARALFRWALSILPCDEAISLRARYTVFEKQHGDSIQLENAVLETRKIEYDQQLALNPFQYDLWFERIRLEDELCIVDADDSKKDNSERMISLYESAVKNIPLTKEKVFWKRYIYLWIYYAIWMELEGKGIEDALMIYRRCVDIIPHSQFTFKKIWSLYSKCLIRAGDLGRARKMLGYAIGVQAKRSVFSTYVDLEVSLREFDRCRILFQKWILWKPDDRHRTEDVWLRWASLESALGDTDRARMIYSSGISSLENLEDSFPFSLFSAFVSFEEFNYSHPDKLLYISGLYEKWLGKNAKTVEIWKSYASFVEINGNVEEEREIYQRAVKMFSSEPHSLLAILESWMASETRRGNLDFVRSNLEPLLPVSSATNQVFKIGSDSFEHSGVGWMFPEQTMEVQATEEQSGVVPEKDSAATKLLELAYKWRQRKTDVSDSDSDSSLDESAY